MKAPRFGITVWLAVAGAVAVASGCGARTVPEAQTGASTGASTNEVGLAVAGAATAPPAGDAAAAPPVKRSESPVVVLPPEVNEVVKLVESGAGDEVVRAYVSSSQVPFDLSLDEIIYLRDIGVSDGVIAAMMRRASELRDREHETQAMQTNLVAAVEQIRQAIATNGPVAEAPGASEMAPAAVVAEAAPPAPSPVVTAGAAAPADAPQEVTQFYSALSPYGTWYQVPSYGWVWQPSVVVVNNTWAPYYHGGRWVWSDWGWYWTSDYSWGWAPFHYGRWTTYPGLGWCWAPGSVWGPSWVTWRHCDTHIGWAPLPPACGWSSGVGLTWYGSGVSVGFGFGLSASCYTFVPYNRFCHRNVAHHGVRGHEAHGIYNNTTVVNNVINGDNNVIVNSGVGLTTVATRSRSEVPKVRVAPLPSESRQELRVDRVERSKDGLVVYKPSPVEASPGATPTLRSEVRPRTSTPSTLGALPPGGTRSPGSPALRANTGERPASANAVTAKPLESRGAPAASMSPMSGSSGGRSTAITTPRPNANTPGVRSAPSRTTPSPATAPKIADGRGTSAPQAAAPSAAGGSPGAIVGPSRQTTPVPLGDATRNLPAGAREVPARGSGTPAVGSKPSAESRSSTTTGGAAVRNYQPMAPRATTAPTYGTAPRSSVSTPAPAAAPARGGTPGLGSAPSSSVAPRSTYSAPGAAVSPASRPSYSAPAPASRPSYSAPAPAVRPSYSAPAPASRPSYSAPAPAARPSYSAPAPVAAPAPRPSYSAPAPSASPSRSAVSAPAPSAAPASGGGSAPRGGGSRAQQN
jgi:hypothetical protein